MEGLGLRIALDKHKKDKKGAKIYPREQQATSGTQNTSRRFL